VDKPVHKSRSFRDLDVWKLAIQLVKNIYLVTQKFPAQENFGLISQVRRAAISIPSNVAEGQGRKSAKEFKQFLGFALGSTAELETQLVIAQEIGYLTSEDTSPLFLSLDRIRKMIRSLSSKLQ
jgi:four helix bundle protein